MPIPSRVVSRGLLRLLAAAYAGFALLRAADPGEIPLWPGAAPGSEGRDEPGLERVTDGGDHVVTRVHRPTLTPYLPEGATGAVPAVIVIPGGGHRELWMDHEGHHVGRWLQSRGVAAFVLKYRLARATNSPYTIADHAVGDTRRAIRMLRHRATGWNLDPDRIGVLGFSAGGELAWQASATPAPGDPAADDPVEREDARPAFQALIYPGRSGDIQAAPGVPPTFLLAGELDRKDISEGLAEAYLRLRRAGISTEFHLYAGVGHGFGLRPGNRGPAAAWPERFLDWMLHRPPPR